MPWIDWFVTDEGHHLPKPVSRGVELFGRFGFAARGLFYLAMGTLAALAAMGMGDLAEVDNAMEWVAQLPFGTVAVIAVAAGLSAYAVWRLAQAIFNLDHFDDSTQARLFRFYFILDGLFHAGFAVIVILALTGGAGGGDGAEGTAARGGDETRQWTARVMRQPAGRWLVGAAGVGTILSGLYLFFRAFTTRFRQHWSCEHVPEVAVQGWILCARGGEIARGVAFVLVGLFVTRAAWRFDPEEARGMGESLQVLAEQPFGRFWIFAVAAGLLAYGVYSMIDARYRTIARGIRESELARQA